MEWIADRLPTADDADEDGEVTVQNRPKAEPSASPYFHWSMVLPGMAWCHTDIWEAPAKPALAVGQRWRRRDGKEVTISEHDTIDDDGYPFRAGAHWYRADGTVTGVPDADLVELIEPAAEPEPEPEPAPAPKPALAVGQRWRRRDGEVVTVERYDNNHPYGATHPFWAGGSSYTVDGIYNGLERPGSDLDLVELIEPAAEPATEPAPVTTPRRFLWISRTVWLDQHHTIDAVADDGTAWWMGPDETEWQQLPALPAREVPRF